MTKRQTTPATEARPSLWAVALFVASSSFALLSIVLLSTGYGLA